MKRSFSFARQGSLVSLGLVMWACAQGQDAIAPPVGTSSGNGGSASVGGGGGSTGGSSTSSGTGGKGAGVGGAASTSGSGGTNAFGGAGGTSGGAGGTSGGAGGTSGGAGGTTGGTAGTGGTTGGTAGTGGTTGGTAGTGGSGGDPPSYGGAGSIDDCNAATVGLVTAAYSALTTVPNDACVALPLNYKPTTKLNIMTDGTTESGAYPLPYEYASCEGTSSGTLAANYEKIWFYGATMSTGVTYACDTVYLKFNGDGSKDVAFYHYE